MNARRRAVINAVALTAVLVLISLHGSRAAASNMVLNCPATTTANPDGTFCVRCTITNQGTPGAVRWFADNIDNCTDLVAYPSSGVTRLGTGEVANITVCGRLQNPAVGGSFRTRIRYVNEDGDVIGGALSDDVFDGEVGAIVEQTSDMAVASPPSP